MLSIKHANFNLNYNISEISYTTWSQTLCHARMGDRLRETNTEEGEDKGKWRRAMRMKKKVKRQTGHRV